MEGRDFSDYASSPTKEYLQDLSFEYSSSRKIMGIGTQTPARAHSELRRRLQSSSRERNIFDFKGSATPKMPSLYQNVSPLYQKFLPSQNISELKPIIDKSSRFVPVRHLSRHVSRKKERDPPLRAVVTDECLHESSDYSDDFESELQENDNRVKKNYLPPLALSKIGKNKEVFQEKLKFNEAPREFYFITTPEPDNSVVQERYRKEKEEALKFAYLPRGRLISRTPEPDLKNSRYQDLEQHTDNNIEERSNENYTEPNNYKPLHPKRFFHSATRNTDSPANDRLDKTAHEPISKIQENSVNYETPNKLNRPMERLNNPKIMANEKKPPSENHERFIQEIELHTYIEEKTSFVTVPLGEVSRKKITVKLLGEGARVLKVYSSDPSLLALKDPEIEVSGEDSVKLPLRIQAPEAEGQKKYTIYIFKDDKPWQKIYINASFE